jgi:hypothetical protein
MVYFEYPLMEEVDFKEILLVYFVDSLQCFDDSDYDLFVCVLVQ